MKQKKVEHIVQKSKADEESDSLARCSIIHRLKTVTLVQSSYTAGSMSFLQKRFDHLTNHDKIYK